MNYLIIEGYESAAIKFAQEANISPHFQFYDIQERVQIRNAIHSGDIRTAIERINELYPQVSTVVFFLMSCRTPVLIAMIKPFSCTTLRLCRVSDEAKP